ncbi:hypothetical protein [Roseateles asaccharophilus]|uniref:Uncharacterized protein n=1 Tax=Roseateles asaccharophilus TaxID=582607 RepID=A0ABU2A984_9BURK|nr:hypothetical protein [Roseateles asaccharophilus]MDR7333758.1 hypothetical protein [Roseateles asaccharophilus]
MKNRLLLVLLLAFGLGVLAWAWWPGAAPTPAAVEAPTKLRAPTLLALGGAATETVASAPAHRQASGCTPIAPLPPHEAALATQRAIAALTSASGGDAVLALLLQKPAAEDRAAQLPWAQQVRDAALRSGDVAALRWAAGACIQLPQATVCRRELLQQRLRLEPDNGLHWLEWLHEDPASADEAWTGLAASRRWLERPGAWLERLDRALPPNLPAPHRQGLLNSLAAREADWAPPPPADLGQVCGHWGPGHALGAACRHATTLMLTKSDSPRARQQGESLAQLTGQEVPPPPAVVSPAIKPLRDCAA